jgi:hypothetical protein
MDGLSAPIGERQRRAGPRESRLRCVPEVIADNP